VVMQVQPTQVDAHDRAGDRTGDEGTARGGHLNECETDAAGRPGHQHRPVAVIPACSSILIAVP
jgi:hypothetical protein